MPVAMSSSAGCSHRRSSSPRNSAGIVGRHQRLAVAEVHGSQHAPARSEVHERLVHVAVEVLGARSEHRARTWARSTGIGRRWACEAISAVTFGSSSFSAKAITRFSGRSRRTVKHPLLVGADDERGEEDEVANLDGTA